MGSFVCVSVTEGKRLGRRHRCRFLEVSALLDHRVEDLLAFVVRQTRLERNKNDQMTSSEEADDEVAHRRPCILLAFGFCGKLLHS